MARYWILPETALVFRCGQVRATTIKAPMVAMMESLVSDTAAFVMDLLSPSADNFPSYVREWQGPRRLVAIRVGVVEQGRSTAYQGPRGGSDRRPPDSLSALHLNSKVRFASQQSAIQEVAATTDRHRRWSAYTLYPPLASYNPGSRVSSALKPIRTWGWDHRWPESGSVR
jgi:hypothetical protein